MDTFEYPEKIVSEEQLEELLSRPGPEVTDMFSRTEGDVIFLGIGGKIGPSLARMARRACDSTGRAKRIYGVSLFESEEQRAAFEKQGIETIHGDLLDHAFIQTLPRVKNVFFLAGMKFGSEENLSLTWAVNTYMPAMVAEYFRDSRIAAFSTGCVYPLVPVESGGSKESDHPESVGEYAQSCLGRERMFGYGSRKYKTPVILIRLNYSVELRYGVLVDIAAKVKNRQPIDLSMGHFNVIWQGDVNDFVLRSLEVAASPAVALNITGKDTLRVRDVAMEFGKLFGEETELVGKEAPTALLNNAGHAFELFGQPRVPIDRVIGWIAEWMKAEKKLLGKPTHFEVRDGKY
jgi:nucleoside-diphosphate-sugar epimerase